MNKLKKFYQSNRIFVILMGISFFCLALILFALINYMFNQTTNDNYGNRLNGVESVKIEDKLQKEIKTQIEENDNVDHASLRIKGKILYINIYIKEENIDDSKNIAIKSLELLKDEQKSVYDIHFIIDLVTEKEETIFPIMGSKKSDNTIITWTNYSK